MAYQIRVLPGAIEDAEELYRWIARDSPPDAARWLEGLFEAIESLSSMPLRAKKAPESDLIGIEVRQLIYTKNYRILFIVDGDTVLVYHVRHGAQERMTEDDF